MIEGIIGRKIGMTETFTEDGNMLVVTAIEAGPCFVVQKKELERDGYEAIQLGFDEIKPQRANRSKTGHFKKAKTPPLRILREFDVIGEGFEDYKVGDVIRADLFSDGDYVDVSAKSKGKGFAGVMKRYGFAGQPDSHGGMAHRRPGSIGQASYPGRVFKGQKMPGHMGAENVTVQKLQVVKSDPERNLILVKGSVPGPNGSVVYLRHTSKGRK